MPEPIPLGQLMEELLEQLETTPTHHEAAADAAAFVLPESLNKEFYK